MRGLTFISQTRAAKPAPATRRGRASWNRGLTAVSHAPSAARFLGTFLVPFLAATLLVPFLAAALAVSLTSDAAASWRETTWTDGALVDVQILVEGRRAPLYRASRGEDRHYFRAEEGHDYAIRVRNVTGERVGVLIAVDGINVVSGDRSRLSSGEAMYILGPWETSTIEGWRTSLRDIQRFVFVDERASYAERTGQGNADMGWIRVLAFREDRPNWGWYSHPGRGDELLGDRSSRGESPSSRPGPPDAAPPQAAPQASSRESAPSPPAPSAGGRAEVQSENRADGDALSRAPAERGYSSEMSKSFPGTGWGEHRVDRVRRVDFRPESRPRDHHVLRYEYASGLHALGIYPRGDRLWEREHGDLGFARPPR